MAVPLDVSSSAPVFAALGDERRLQLVMRLSRSGPMSISRLADGTGVTRQAVTRHLCVLEGAGLARSERRGRERIWEIEPAQLQVARRYLDMISQRWDDTLARMKASIEVAERGTTTTVPES